MARAALHDQNRADAPGDAERHVRSQIRCKTLKLRLGVAKAPEVIQPHQGGCTITGPTGQASPDRDSFAQSNAGAKLAEAGSIAQQPGRPNDQVVVPEAEGRVITTELDLGISPVAKGQTVRQVNALHDHRQLVKAIGTQAQNFQMKIHLGRCRHRDRAHQAQRLVALIQTCRQSDPGRWGDVLWSLLKADSSLGGHGLQTIGLGH